MRFIQAFLLLTLSVTATYSQQEHSYQHQHSRFPCLATIAQLNDNPDDYLGQVVVRDVVISVTDHGPAAPGGELFRLALLDGRSGEALGRSPYGISAYTRNSSLGTTLVAHAIDPRHARVTLLIRSVDSTSADGSYDVSYEADVQSVE